MAFKDLPIRRKVTGVTMLTSVAVLLLTAAAFTVLNFVSYRQTMARNLGKTAAILAGQIGPALAAKDDHEAGRMLNTLRADPDLVRAALYDAQDNLFARYPPADASAAAFPTALAQTGHRFQKDHILLIEPVPEGGSRLGTLCLEATVRPSFARLRIYVGIALLVLGGAVIVALVLANALQQRISGPILALAKTVREISMNRDFSLRAPASGGDELGLLTDAFNQMLTHIQRDITEHKAAQQVLERQAATLHEQTELLKQTKEQLRLLNAELELRVQTRTAELTSSNKEMEAFTYSVAHDLRAPLRHIDAFSKILLEDFAAALPPEGRRYLENVRNGSRHMSQLVDDLLNLARVGRQELKREPTPLDRLVGEVVAELKGDSEGRQIEWHIQPLPVLECDAGLMKLVFANLLANALKFTRPRPVAIIEVGCLQMDVGKRAVFVCDNGVGFNMKYIDKLFGVFQRLHRPEDFEGTGVGLAIVERIVRKHGGSVWAEAAVDKGAIFYFSMPGLGG
jgi:signal transduction histidine kinase